jgi:hypothetical protein
MDVGERAAALAEVERADLIARRAAELLRELDTVERRLGHLEALLLPLAICTGEGCAGTWSVGGRYWWR